MLSSLPEARIYPSELNAIDLTKSECPFNSFIRAPFSKLTNFIISSVLLKANIFPSALIATV